MLKIVFVNIFGIGENQIRYLSHLLCTKTDVEFCFNLNKPNPDRIIAHL